MVPPGHALGLLLALLGVVAISPDALLVRLVSADQWTMMFWRGVLPALVVAAALWLRHGHGTAARFRAVGGAGLAVAGLFAVASVFFVSAILLTTVANVLVIVSVQPLMSALLSRWILREPVRARTWIATVSVFVGIAVIFSGSLESGGLLGDLCALVSASCIAVKMVVIRHARAVSMVPAMALGSAALALLVAPLAAPLAVPAVDVLPLAAMGLVVLPVPLFAVTVALRHLPVPEVSLVMLLESVFGPLLVWLVLDEVPAAETFLGGGLILATLAAYLAVGLRRTRRAPALP